ncbi:hypothetical protein, partial [Vibrio sp. IB15]|uniref:hypothetical protein n=1 Tax=Vibrio sp. IB15 TaxID=2779368 RepID=UPI001E41147A
DMSWLSLLISSTCDQETGYKLAFSISLKIVSKRNKVKLLLCHFFLNHYCCSNDESDDQT